MHVPNGFEHEDNGVGVYCGVCVLRGVKAGKCDLHGAVPIFSFTSETRKCFQSLALL